MRSAGKTAALSFVTSIVASVAAVVISQLILDSWRERRANASLPRPPVDGFDHT